MNTMSQYELLLLGMMLIIKKTIEMIGLPYPTKCTKMVMLFVSIKMYSLGKSIIFCYSATWQGNRSVDYYVECVAGAVAQNVAPLK